MQHSLSTLARQFDVESNGDGALLIAGVCGLSDDLPGHLSFVTSEKHVAQARASRVPAFITPPALEISGKATLVHDNPEYLIARIAALFAPSQLAASSNRHASASIDPSARIAADVEIGANVVVGRDVTIGAGSRVFPNVVIMDRCVIGTQCIIYPNCTLREDTVLGERVILQPGVSIGGDGYGYAPVDGKHVKIPQLGRVVLEDDVEIGANSTVDRARFTETRIGSGTKIDNLVMVGHNVTTGEDCLLVAQVGISGSTHLGNRVVLAGQVGTVGHVTVGDDVTVLGKGGITKDIPEPGVYAGMPLKPARLWRRAMARLYSGLK